MSWRRTTRVCAFDERELAAVVAIVEHADEAGFERPAYGFAARAAAA
jgi:hypothetical protein